MGNTREIAIDHSERLLLRADDVVRRTQFSRAKVYQMMASGELPTIRAGRSVRVPARALDQWIEQRTMAALQ